jgi:hypothetical protein
MNSNTEQDRPSSFLAPAPQHGPGMLDVAQSRAAQEVQASMVIAKKYPRNEIECVDAIKNRMQADASG